jgi:hypothetical protein
MDGSRFDALTKTLRTGTPRRTLLRGVIGAALVTLGVARTARAKTKPYNCCPAGGTCRTIVIAPGEVKRYEEIENVVCSKVKAKKTTS